MKFISIHRIEMGLENGIFKPFHVRLIGLFSLLSYRLRTTDESEFDLERVKGDPFLLAAFRRQIISWIC